MNGITGGQKDDARYATNMETRLTVLETRWDTILPTLATKVDIEQLRFSNQMDLALLRTDMQRMYSSALRWTIGTLVTLVVAQSALIVSVLRITHP